MILEHKGTEIFYVDEGEGDAIVLLHGFLENSTMWNDLKPIWSQSHRIISIDLLGHGQSGCLGYIHTMEAMAEAVNDVLMHLKVESAIVIGHSMGGYVALALMESVPKAVKGLCLMNSSALSDDKQRQLNRDRAVLAVKENHKTFIGMSISNLFAPDNRAKFIDEIQQVKIEALKTPLQGIIAALEGMKIRKDRTHLLSDNSIKKMAIIGSRDPVLDTKAVKQQFEGTDVEIVEFYDGHMSHIENKYDLSYKIMHFIEK